MISINGEEVFESVFPDGTKQIKVELYRNAHIRWNYESMDELFDLMCIKDKLDELGVVNIDLTMPYVPNARMDKTSNPYECVTLKTFAKAINRMNFDKVYVLDPHSVQVNAIKNLVEIDIRPYIMWAIKEFKADNDLMENPVAMFPDSGSLRRYSLLDVNEVGTIRYACCKKVRDYEKRTVASTEVTDPEAVRDKPVLIMDDICSKGNTFIKAYEAIRQYTDKPIGLYVTHCEKNILNGDVLKYMRVYTTDSIKWDMSERPSAIKEKVIP